jgi:hypothetical protein
MGSRVALKNSKRRPKRKNNELGKKNEDKKKIKTIDRVDCPLGDSFIPSMKSQNGNFWMVH